MTEEDLARAVAAEMGTDIAASTDNQLKGETPRALGLTEAVIVATFLVQCAQLAVQCWDASGNREALAKRLDEDAPRPAKLDPQKRRGVIDRIVAALGKT